MTKNYRAEAELRDLLEQDPTVKGTAYDDFYTDLHEGFIADTSTEGLKKHIADTKETRPHRFIAASNNDAIELGRKAWLEGNITAAGRFVSLYGSEAAERMAARFKNTLSSGKPGIAPEGDATKDLPKDHKSNPWADIPANVDPRTGRYNAAAVSKMASLCKVDVALAARIAASVGARIGDVRPRRRAA